MPKDPSKFEKPTKQVVLEAVRYLHGLEQIVTRETLADETGLSLTTLDDRLAVLVDDGLVIRVQRGVFVPAEQYPATRAISRTILPNGFVKIEIGDELLTLTPRESRMLGELTAGSGQQAATIELGQQATQGIGDLMEKYIRIQHRIAALEKRLRGKDDTQGELLGEN